MPAYDFTNGYRDLMDDDYIPSMSEQMANCEDPFVCAMLGETNKRSSGHKSSGKQMKPQARNRASVNKYPKKEKKAMARKTAYVDKGTGEVFDRLPAGGKVTGRRVYGGQKNGTKAKVSSQRQYSDAEKKAYNMGLGSQLSRTPEGREKQIMKMFGNDPAAVQSYKNGRRDGGVQKKNYLQKQRLARRGRK